jgi:hypothetical protein
MATALIHLAPKQKARLAGRAKKRGRSFSEEVRNAMDMYLARGIRSASPDGADRPSRQ